MKGSDLVARWGSRKESPLEIATRLKLFLTKLSEVNPSIRDWSIDQRNQSFPVEHSDEWLNKQLNESRPRDDNGNIMEDLGHTMWLSAATKARIGMLLQAGGYDLVPGMHNQCMLTFKAPSVDQTDSYESGTALRMLQCLIGCWDPDWATWQTVPWIRLQKPVESRPIIGWFTYLKDVQLIEVPVGTVHPYRNGTIIQTAPRYEDVTDEMIATLHHHLLATGELHNM